MECSIPNCTESLNQAKIGKWKRDIWSLQSQFICPTTYAFMGSVASGVVPANNAPRLVRALWLGAPHQHFPPQRRGQELRLCRQSFTHANSGCKRKTTRVQGKDTSLICSNLWKIHIFIYDIRNTSVTSHSSSEISHQTPWLTLRMPWEKPDHYNELNLEITVIFSVD